jgi:hypothetical protein
MTGIMGYKMQFNWVSLSAVGLALLAASGCNTLTSASVNVVTQGYICGVNQTAGVELVSDAAPLPRDSARIGIDKPQADDETGIDRDQYWIVRVNMGQQPSGGYGLRLVSEQLEITSDNTAKVVLQWLQPKPGSVQTLALTYPCLHLQIAKGNYSRLEIVDQTGKIRHYLALK